MPRNYGLTTKVIKSTKFKSLDIQYLRVLRITIVKNLRGLRK
jgi:hypothetical protein